MFQRFDGIDIDLDQCIEVFKELGIIGARQFATDNFVEQFNRILIATIGQAVQIIPGRPSSGNDN